MVKVDETEIKGGTYQMEMYTFNQVELLGLLEDLRHITVTRMTVDGKKSFDYYITVLRRGKLLSILAQNKLNKDMVVMGSEGTIKLLTKVDEVVTNKEYTEFKQEFPSYFNNLLALYEEGYTNELRVLLEETHGVLKILLGLVNSFEVIHRHILPDEFEKGKGSLDESYTYYLDKWKDSYTRFEIGVQYVSTRLQVTRYLTGNYTDNYKEFILKGIDNTLVSQLSFLKELKEELLKSILKALKLNLDLYKIYQKTGRVQKVSDVSELLNRGCGKEVMDMILSMGVLDEIYHNDKYLVKMRKEYSKVLSDDYSEAFLNQFF